MDVDLQMTTMIVGEEESITLNRTIVSGHFTFWIAYVNTTTELTIVWAFFVIASICILGNLVTMGKNPSRTQTTHTEFCCHQIPRISRFTFSNCFYFYYFTNLVAIVKSFAMFLRVLCEFILSRGVTVYYQIFHHNLSLEK